MKNLLLAPVAPNEILPEAARSPVFDEFGQDMKGPIQTVFFSVFQRRGLTGDGEDFRVWRRGFPEKNLVVYTIASGPKIAKVGLSAHLERGLVAVWAEAIAIKWEELTAAGIVIPR